MKRKQEGHFHCGSLTIRLSLGKSGWGWKEKKEHRVKTSWKFQNPRTNGQDLSLNSCQRQDIRLCGGLLSEVTRWGDPTGEVTSQKCVCRHGRACGRAVATPLGGTQTHHILISPLGKGIVPGMVRFNETEFILRVAKF